MSKKALDAAALVVVVALAGCGEPAPEAAKSDEASSLEVAGEPKPIDLEDLDQVRSAASAGNAMAQFALGDRYARGDGVEKDAARAAEWFRKSAEQGHAGAQLFLGNHHASGDGVAADPAEAVRWYMRAAEQGVDGSSAAAQFLLGVAYYNGNGVEQDFEEAYFWLDIAEQSDTGDGDTGDGDSGDGATGAGLKEMAASQFSFERLAAIQQRVKEWREAREEP